MSHSILLVEDDADERYVMHLAFTELAYTDQVKVFKSGDEILAYLRNLPHESLYPALLVFDYNMPGMNGAELLMRLKMNESLRNIPVAMYSAGMQQLEGKLKGLGAAYCFEKGDDVKDVYALTHKLKNIVEGQEVNEEL